MREASTLILDPLKTKVNKRFSGVFREVYDWKTAQEWVKYTLKIFKNL